ncbi:glutathione S-transferase N-terminal domain-containing protein [Sphingomonas sp. S1-29]|uniref:glutathione S-transferase family protein n=1 Tax=Sphingomonas sp. S1-29 TaxID=2991074 RepID=UPI00223FA700|nr:glutathione S-transferase N-terminal domain-containing protein [Sphingomonas sp. S1-29]UZK69230.1 glutathione S-transferase N-terminal domain-containing protein [Sphingomonas sp. S1-29]
MKLYDAPWAPSPRRVRIFLAEKGVVIDREHVDLRDSEQLRDAYLKINPRGAVPALELDDGEVLCESAAICRYIEALYPEPSLFGSDPLAIGRIESWTRRIEGDGYAAAVYAFRNRSPAFVDRGIPGNWPPVAQIPELAARGMVMWDGFVKALDERLADRTWIAGGGYSFADITALVTIDFAKSAAKLSVPERAKHILRWHAAATARPSAAA